MQHTGSLCGTLDQKFCNKKNEQGEGGRVLNIMKRLIIWGLEFGVDITIWGVDTLRAKKNLEQLELFEV